jgi:hypothetical protein
MEKPKNSRKKDIRTENNPQIPIFFNRGFGMLDIATTTGTWW